MTTRSAIINAIGCKHLELEAGKGYFYFIYDDGGPTYETRSVYVYRLNHMTKKQWIEKGRDFVDYIKQGKHLP